MDQSRFYETEVKKYKVGNRLFMGQRVWVTTWYHVLAVRFAQNLD
jgi:hypothetical protein